MSPPDFPLPASSKKHKQRISVFSGMMFALQLLFVKSERDQQKSYLKHHFSRGVGLPEGGKHGGLVDKCILKLHRVETHTHTKVNIQTLSETLWNKNNQHLLKQSEILSDWRQTLSLAHWIVCSMTEGKDLRVQNGISSSGGSLWKINGEAQYLDWSLCLWSPWTVMVQESTRAKNKNTVSHTLTWLL